MKKKNPKNLNNNLKKKRKRQSLNESEQEPDNNLSENDNKKEKNEKTNEYLTITKKDDKNFINNLKLKFIKSSKKDYKIKCQELFDNVNKSFYQVRNSKILKSQNINILFIHIYNKLILYEIKNDLFIFLTEFLLKEKLGLISIEKFFLLKNNLEKDNKESIIYICFVCYNEVVISKLDMNKNKNLNIYDRIKIPQNNTKVFYKMINENLMIFDGITLITLFPKLKIKRISIKYSDESYFKSVAILDGKDKIGILTDKDLFIYNVNINKNLGKINIENDISSYEMGIKKYKSKFNKNDTLFILYSEKGVYLYDYEKMMMNKKLALEGQIKSKIRKVKQLYNYNIAILYNYYNLAIYNIENDTVSYHYKSNWTRSPGNEDFPLLIKLSDDFILFGSDPNTITILKYLKGEIFGYITDKKNKRKCELCKSIKIYGEDLKKCPNDTLNEFYAFIKNSKTTLIVKLSY